MLEFAFNSFVTLLVVVDPLGMAPIFAALTGGYAEKRKREAAVRGTMLGTGVLLIFALAGDVLLEALGIGIPAFRIAGGVLLFLLSLDMIFASPEGLRSRTTREQQEDDYNQDVSVFPLAIPLLAGPGAITTVLLFTGGRSAVELGVFVAVLLFVLLLTLASLLLAPRVMALFGETGANVLSRVLGVLLAALAVQFVLDGIQSSLAGRRGSTAPAAPFSTLRRPTGSTLGNASDPKVLALSTALRAFRQSPPKLRTWVFGFHDSRIFGPDILGACPSSPS